MDGCRDDQAKHQMISLLCGIYNVTQMDLSMQQKQTHRHREQICGCRGEGVGEGWIGPVGLVRQTIIYRMDKQL